MEGRAGKQPVSGGDPDRHGGIGAAGGVGILTVHATACSCRSSGTSKECWVVLRSVCAVRRGHLEDKVLLAGSCPSGAGSPGWLSGDGRRLQAGAHLVFPQSEGDGRLWKSGGKGEWCIFSRSDRIIVS